MKPEDLQPDADGIADDAILEGNLRRLFAVSYLPIAPSASFKTRLHDAAIDEVARRHARPAMIVVGSTRTWRSPTRLVAAAIVLVLLGAALMLALTKRAGTTSMATAEPILASGSVAVHARAGTGWRAFDALERERGIDVAGQSLEIATPPDSGARLWFGADGVVEIAPDSRASIVVEDAQPTFALEHGTIQVERYVHDATAFGVQTSSERSAQDSTERSPQISTERPAQDSTERSAQVSTERSAQSSTERSAQAPGWTISAHGSAVVLERGRIEARIEDASAFGGTGPCLVARLERGVATTIATTSGVDATDVSRVRTSLSIGVALALQGGRLFATSIDISSPDETAARESIASATTPAANTTKIPDEPQSAPQRARITGIVRVADNNEAMPNEFTVTLLRRERGPSLAQPQVQVLEGTAVFAFEGVKPGPYELFVEAPGFAVWRKEPIDLKGANPQAIEVALERGTTVRGRVIDAATGAPIEDAWVLSEDDIPAQVIPFATTEPDPAIFANTLQKNAALSNASRTWTASTHTRADGTFELSALSKSRCRLRATHPGYGAAWSSIFESGVDATRANVEFKLEIGGTIEGHVAHDDGATWANATVVASPINKGGRMSRMSYATSITDSEGHYRITDLPSGTYVVLHALDARRPRFDGTLAQTQVESGQTTTVDLPTKVGGTRVEGNVLGRDGTAIDDIEVTLQAPGQHGIGGARPVRARRGHFVFPAVAAGQYDVFVGRGMGSSFTRQMSIEVPEAADFSFDVQLAEGSIRGHALADGDKKLAGPNFLLLEVERNGRFEFAGRGLTDSEGRFRFDRLQPAAYRVTVFPMERGLAPASSATLWIEKDDALVECELTLEPGAALRVKVVDADGAAIAGASVSFVDDEGRAMRFTSEDVTDAAGTLPIPALRPGHWTITAKRGERSAGPVLLELFVGEEREVVIEFPR